MAANLVIVVPEEDSAWGTFPKVNRLTALICSFDLPICAHAVAAKRVA
jgi:hypothetical protein